MSNLKRAFFLSMMLGLFLGPALGGEPPASKSPEAPKPSPMEQSWLDLEKGELPAARALLRMSTTPAESVAFLKVHLKPLKLDPEELTKALARLDSEDGKVWNAAFEELEYFDPRLAVDLETLMENVTTKPLRQRLVEILSGRDAGSLGEGDVQLRNTGGDSFNFTSGNGSWWAEVKVSRLGSDSWRGNKKKWARAARAIALLEHIKSPEAIALLKDMATGHPDAAPTKYSAEALQRIEGKDSKAKSDEPAKP